MRGCCLVGKTRGLRNLGLHPKRQLIGSDSCFQTCRQQTTHTPASRTVARVGATKDFEGEGEYKRRDNLTARLTAEIIDILPNGNLIVLTIQGNVHEIEPTLPGRGRRANDGIPRKPGRLLQAETKRLAE